MEMKPGDEVKYKGMRYTFDGYLKETANCRCILYRPDQRFIEALSVDVQPAPPRKSKKDRRIEELEAKVSDYKLKYIDDHLAQPDQPVAWSPFEVNLADGYMVILAEERGEWDRKYNELHQICAGHCEEIRGLKQQLAAAGEATRIVDALEKMPCDALLTRNFAGYSVMVPGENRRGDIYTEKTISEALQNAGLLQEGE